MRCTTTGGRSSIDGVQGDDLQKNTRFGATYAYAIDRHHSLKLQASSGVFTRTGSDYDTVSIAWQYRWARGIDGTIIRVPARDRRVPIALQDGTSESSNSRAPSKKIWMPMQNSRNADTHAIPQQQVCLHCHESTDQRFPCFPRVAPPGVPA